MQALPNASGGPATLSKRGPGGPLPRTAGTASGVDSSVSEADSQSKWPHDKYDEIQQ